VINHKQSFPKINLNIYCITKNWIDTVQWHFEDIIRDPNIDPVAALTKEELMLLIKNVQIW
jgi:hypothetical protein